MHMLYFFVVCLKYRTVITTHIFGDCFIYIYIHSYIYIYRHQIVLRVFELEIYITRQTDTPYGAPYYSTTKISSK